MWSVLQATGASKDEELTRVLMHDTWKYVCMIIYWNV